MSILVVDASVAIKWFVPEVHSPESRRWLHGPDELHVPEVFFELEFTNIVWKKLLRGEFGKQDATDILKGFKKLSVVEHPDSPLISDAFEIASVYRRSVYDSLYLALAERLDGQMLTADQRLVNALAGTPLAHRVRHVSVSPP